MGRRLRARTRTFLDRRDVAQNNMTATAERRKCPQRTGLSLFSNFSSLDVAPAASWTSALFKTIAAAVARSRCRPFSRPSPRRWPLEMSALSRSRNLIGADVPRVPGPSLKGRMSPDRLGRVRGPLEMSALFKIPELEKGRMSTRVPGPNLKRGGCPQGARAQQPCRGLEGAEARRNVRPNQVRASLIGADV